ncbi:LOW QUALITY PROTEIN: hypothetical protein QYF61_005751 [Mycteria americana]|uniref:RNase H type-1 domain-containing protein n=1 Tax=Mycteria americana TaxID=33587 RepID=A0AAN7S2D8_MYCAM|nr:LOW QUALITY PROTEIN: hypothetical protein QYF61_005751 [Mycteria americana]
MQKDFSRRPGKHFVTWLLRCWDSGASSLELEGKEAKQLGSLSRERGIDKAIGKGAQVLSLWRHERKIPFKDDVTCRPGKWTTMERGIQYLKELTDMEDPDEVKCTRPTWRKLVRSAPASYANSLAILTCKDGEGQTADELAGQLWQYKESLSSSLMSAVEKLVQLSNSKRIDPTPHLYRPVSQLLGRSSAQERGYSGCTPRATLWFYLHDHGKNMRKWDGKSALTLEARVCELQGKTITQGSSSSKIATPVSSGQFPRQSKRADLTPDLHEGTLDSYVQETLANALWGWLQQWKQSNWQRRSKPIWAAALWQNIAARVENLVVKVRHIDAHVPKSRATEEHQNKVDQVDQAAKIEVAQVDLDWQHKGVDLTMDAIAEVIHECETCAAIKQAKQLKPLCYGG